MLSRLLTGLAGHLLRVAKMLYVAVALVVYLFTALDLLRGGAPASLREALGGALACALVAAVWPIALVWRGLLGGSRPDPVQPGMAVSNPFRSRA